jgi:hypothetical protein
MYLFLPYLSSGCLAICKGNCALIMGLCSGNCGVHEGGCLLGYSAMLLPWWWKQWTPLKHYTVSIRLHSATCQNTAIFMLVTVGTSVLTMVCFCKEISDEAMCDTATAPALLCPATDTHTQMHAHTHALSLFNSLLHAAGTDQMT